MRYTEKLHAQQLISLCKQKDISEVIISPGSRNAPLVIGFTEDVFFTCFSIVDERCAAFFALGIAQKKRKPVALICTSGSAVLNYYPAIAEAYYSEIPLLVLSADRPPQKIDIGDGQTIRQSHVFRPHILYSDDLVEFNHLAQTKQRIHNESAINAAINTAVVQKGPVHLNIAFEEPLYRTTQQAIVQPKNIVADAPQGKSLSEAVIKTWKAARKRMIIVGVLPPDSISEKVLHELLQDESILMLSESTSNLQHAKIVNHIDTLLAPIENNPKLLAQLQPDILISIGGMVVSKKIKKFLRDYSPKNHYHIGPSTAYDTYFSLNEHFDAPINESLETLAKHKATQSFAPYWITQQRRSIEAQQHYLSQIAWSDFRAFNTVFTTLPKGYEVHLSNSSTVRYAQLFKPPKQVDFYCNRGTSGIDGSTSTAIGHAWASPRQNLLITGDLSFFYDSNALWIDAVPRNFKIIIINNQGGGIFKILPGNADSENFERYFVTRHQLTAEHLCNQFDYAYFSASSEDDLHKNLADFYNFSTKPAVLEVFTGDAPHHEILLNYFISLKDLYI
ncbi:MAG: 2-succinyl-5-enolpyruvyl-6-hydroxy-3-cyclohexene-1-carboxylic-acid synthase [Flavobacteriaceae bacterium]|nr:2-succinyl-5-enolpyruvyl-6-hydroxy-3-cyclohexene-1-carboxylic-acid synthase [Flavobacteriaceae bacterium]